VRIVRSNPIAPIEVIDVEDKGAPNVVFFFEVLRHLDVIYLASICVTAEGVKVHFWHRPPIDRPGILSPHWWPNLATVIPTGRVPLLTWVPVISVLMVRWVALEMFARVSMGGP